MPAWSARSSSIRTADCRKRAASCGATARRGTSAATTIPSRPEYNYLREADYCSGACLAIRRELFAALGGFDRRYAPAYYEDADLAFAVRAAGCKLYYQPACTIVHFEGVTSGTDTGSGVKRHQVVNQATFAAKWAAELKAHGTNGVRPELERDRWAQLRVLVVDACMLTPDQDAGLDAHEGGARDPHRAEVQDHVRRRQPRVSAAVRRGAGAGRRRGAVPSVRALDRRPARRSAGASSTRSCCRATTSRRATSTRCARSRPRRCCASTRSTCTSCAPSGWRSSTAASPRRRRARAEREEELALIRKADVTLVVAPVRAVAARGRSCRRRACSCCPPSTTRCRTASRSPSATGLVFIGSFQHPPNVDGVLWYAREVLPRLRERLPGVPTYIVGSNVPPSIRALAADDFVVTGFVKDVDPYFTGCRVSVSPLRYGAGVKGKVNLAMSYGLPVVATSPSIEGMYLVPGQDVLVGRRRRTRSPRRSRRSIATRSLWEQLRAAGRDNIQTHFSRDVARSAITRLIARVQRQAAGRARAAAAVSGAGRASAAARSAPREHAGRTPRARGARRAPRTWSAAATRAARRSRRPCWRAAARQRARRARRRRSPPSRSRRAGSRRARGAAASAATNGGCSSRRL